MNKTSCKLTPRTCEVLREVTAVTGTVDAQPVPGEVEFLILAPGSALKPHCGTTNRRLTLHLGVVVPAGGYIRVGNETRRWHEGKALVFDDSFEHEVIRVIQGQKWRAFLRVIQGQKWKAFLQGNPCMHGLTTLR